MKIICAYLLARLGGNSSPSASDLLNILSSVGIEPDEDMLELFMSQVTRKSIEQVIASGRQKFESLPSLPLIMSQVAGKSIEQVGRQMLLEPLPPLPLLASPPCHTALVPTKKPNRYDHLRVTPLVEIFAITVHCNDQNITTNKCQIFGKISIILEDDEDHEDFVMFDRKEDNPMSVSLDHSLLLTPNTDDTTIIPSKYSILKVELYDKARCNTVVADGVIPLVKTTKSEDWLEDYQEENIPGTDGGVYAKVHYAIFPYAVTATVNIIYFDKADDFDPINCDQVYCYEDDFDYRKESYDVHDAKKYEVNDIYPAANLYGTVSASRGVSVSSDSKISITSNFLFSKSKKDSVQVKSRGFIELSRSMVVVPAYSPLVVEAKFYDGDTESLVSSGIVKFKPCDMRTYKKDIVGNNGCRTRVQVTWSNAYELFFYVNGLFGHRPSTPDITETRKPPPEHSSADSSGDLALPLLDDDREHPLIELFSIVVCSTDGKPLKFYGKVFVNDGDQFCVFKKDKSIPQDCPKLGTFAIVEGTSRSVTTYDDLSISVSLKDVTKARISSGLATFRNIDDYEVANERMCSVIRGERGFAALHYSIFPDGVSAHIIAKVYSKHLPCTIKGTIYARFVIYDVPEISYQKKLYKSILFYNMDGGVALVTSGSTLPLAKSLVSLPRHSYLIIEYELSVGAKSLTGSSLKFVSNSKEPKKIGDDDLSLEVFVKFTNAWNRCERSSKTPKTVLK